MRHLVEDVALLCLQGVELLCAVGQLPGQVTDSLPTRTATANQYGDTQATSTESVGGEGGERMSQSLALAPPRPS